MSANTVEKRLQSEIRKEAKSLGFEVLVIRPQPGIPDGFEDILLLKEGFWGTIEVKDSPTAPYQPLQKERITKHDDWSWARRVDPTNWHDVREELRALA